MSAAHIDKCDYCNGIGCSECDKAIHRRMCKDKTCPCWNEKELSLDSFKWEE